MQEFTSTCSPLVSVIQDCSDNHCEFKFYQASTTCTSLTRFGEYDLNFVYIFLSIVTITCLLLTNKIFLENLLDCIMMK